jgi:predicted metal-binding protein
MGSQTPFQPLILGLGRRREAKTHEPGNLPSAETSRDGRGALVAVRRRICSELAGLAMTRHFRPLWKDALMVDRSATPTMIHVCVNCRAVGENASQGERAGAQLMAELAMQAGPSVAIAPVECLSVCKRPCTIAFSAPGKWTYVYGDFAADSAAEILTAAALYAAAPDGLIPWAQRPAALKKGVVARIPALSVSLAKAEQQA